jgi:hypothetical protein
VDDGSTVTGDNCPLVPMGAAPGTDKLLSAEAAVLKVGPNASTKPLHFVSVLLVACAYQVIVHHYRSADGAHSHLCKQSGSMGTLSELCIAGRAVHLCIKCKHTMTLPTRV